MGARAERPPCHGRKPRRRVGGGPAVAVSTAELVGFFGGPSGPRPRRTPDVGTIFCPRVRSLPFAPVKAGFEPSAFEHAARFSRRRLLDRGEHAQRWGSGRRAAGTGSMCGLEPRPSRLNAPGERADHPPSAAKPGEEDSANAHHHRSRPRHRRVAIASALAAAPARGATPVPADVPATAGRGKRRPALLAVTRRARWKRAA